MRMECMFFVFGLCAVCVLGCSQFPGVVRSTNPDKPDEDEMRAHYSQYVVFGQVGAAASRPAGAVAGVGAINFDIICMYKGTPQPRRILVYGVGNARGHLRGCPSTNLTEGDQVVLFLTRRRRDNYFELEFSPLQGDATVFVDDISLVCGLSLSFPTDLQESQQDPEAYCVDPLPAGDCMPYEPPTTKKPPVTPKQIDTDKGDGAYNTNKDGHTGEVGDGDSGATRLALSSTLVLLATLIVTIL